MAGPVITALRPVDRGLVAVDLDGRAWRTLPLAAAATAGLRVGRELDRAAARELARAVRAAAALDQAARFAGRRERSRAQVERRLAAKGVGAADAARATHSLQEMGGVDDVRFAEGRAQALATRLYGDLAIRHDLVQAGVAEEAIRQALAGVESERGRVARVVRDRGVSARTLRFLAGRGFTDEALEDVALSLE